MIVQKFESYKSNSKLFWIKEDPKTVCFDSWYLLIWSSYKRSPWLETIWIDSLQMTCLYFVQYTHIFHIKKMKDRLVRKKPYLKTIVVRKMNKIWIFFSYTKYNWWQAPWEGDKSERVRPGETVGQCRRHEAYLSLCCPHDMDMSGAAMEHLQLQLEQKSLFMSGVLRLDWVRPSAVLRSGGHWRLHPGRWRLPGERPAEVHAGGVGLRDWPRPRGHVLQAHHWRRVWSLGCKYLKDERHEITLCSD